jgi:uncharacterized protein YndB with AHSA1/START domain
MSDAPATQTAPGTVRLERLLPGPIERLWAYLTDDDLRATWLAGGPLEGRVGGRVSLRFRHADLSPQAEEVPERYQRMADEGHLMEGVVTAWDPPRRLSYTWDDADEASEVTFELQPQADEVLLVVTHRRLDGRATLVSVSGGWHTHLAILRDRLEGRDPPPFWSAHERAERGYAEAFGDVGERLAPPGAATLTAAADGRPLLRLVRHLSAPIDEAWRTVSEPERLDRWYPARLRFEGPVGGWVRETFEGDDTPLPEGTLVAFDPPHRLVFDVAADPGSPEPSVRHPQRIAITLAERSGGSTLVFEHTFGDRSMSADFAAGWQVCLTALERVAHGEPDEEIDPATGPALREAYGTWFGTSA